MLITVVFDVILRFIRTCARRIRIHINVAYGSNGTFCINVIVIRLPLSGLTSSSLVIVARFTHIQSYYIFIIIVIIIFETVG